MLSQQKSVISSDDDDDYELPSLSERIKISLMLQNKNISHVVSFHDSSDSEDGESSFLKFSERIQSTPFSHVKLKQKEPSCTKTEELEILKDVEKNNAPPLNIKLDFSATSESEDEESVFLSFSQRIQSTPQIKTIGSCYITSESDSDEMFSNLSERLNMMTPRTENKESRYITSDSDSDEMFSNLSERLNMMTPRTENKENHDTAVKSDVVKKMSEYFTPLSPQKKKSYKAEDSESDGSFSNFVEKLRTPMSVNRKISCKAVDSESDDSFSSFVDRLRTPLSVNRKIQHKVNETDSDDSFVNNSRKQVFQTPRSQMKHKKDDVLLPKITEMKECNFSLLVQDTPNSLKVRMSENEKDFKALFPPESMSSTFLQKRQSYTRMLYEFYNRKVFNSQLPPDMPLIYDGALKTTAGMTHCSVKNGTYMCSIKLSSSLLNSFGHLKETLLHEMCHAAVWIVNKQHKVRHGPLWQVWASRCNLILPFIECPRRCHDFEISYRVWYQCPKCQWKKGRCKQVRKYHGALCKRCKTPIIVTYA